MKFNFEKPSNSEESSINKLKKAGKKAVLSVALAAGLSAGSGEVVAQNQDDLEKDKIENAESNNPYEHLALKVGSEELEEMLKGYESVPGGLSKEIFLSQNADEIFYLSEPVFAEIEALAKMSAHNNMKLAGKLPSQVADFFKKSSDGYTCVTVVLKRHVDMMSAEAERVKKHFDERERLDDLFQEYKTIKKYLETKDPSEIKTDEDRDKIRRLLDKYNELEKELKELLK